MKARHTAYLLGCCLTSISLYGLPGLAQSTLPLAPANSETESSLIEASSRVETSEHLPLKSGDQVRITVVGFPELSGEQTVTPDGVIQLPMAGNIHVADLAPAAATQKVVTALLPYVRRPQVSLILVEPSPLRVSVTGEVLNPGPHVLSLDEVGNNNVIRLSEILIASGGVTPEADLRHIAVRRRVPNPGSLVQPPRSQVITVDLWEVLQTGDLSLDPIVYNGDEIVVPTAIINQTDQQTLLSSTLAPRRVIVNVAGEVRSPGPVEIAPTSDVNAAIAAAGGPTPAANTGAVILSRRGEEGEIIQEEFRFGEASTTIRNGDLIYVRKSTTSNVLDFLEAISSPLRLFLDAAILNDL